MDVRYRQKIPELLGPGKRFLPRDWGGKGGSRHSLGLEDTRVMNCFSYCKNSSETV